MNRIERLEKRRNTVRLIGWLALGGGMFIEAYAPTVVQPEPEKVAIGMATPSRLSI
jgi:hypothetical protein